jgi:hypothetical protein
MTEEAAGNLIHEGPPLRTQARVDVDFETSPTIGKLAEALAKAQGEMEHATKDADNPHFKSTFATLASVVAAIKGPLATHGVARHQAPMSKAGDVVGVRTTLMHGSGEWIAATVWCKAERPGAQALGSVITYLRRYSLAAAAGVAPDDDDDGEAAEGRGQPPKGRTASRGSSQPSSNGSTGTSASGNGSGTSSETRSTPPTDDAMNRALRLSKLLTSPPPDGCGWTKPHCQKWGKKRFGVDDPTQLTDEQSKDAMLLALAYMAGGDTGYRAKLDELVAAGRVKGDDEKGKAA